MARCLHIARDGDREEQSTFTIAFMFGADDDIVGLICAWICLLKGLLGCFHLTQLKLPYTDKLSHMDVHMDSIRENDHDA